MQVADCWLDDELEVKYVCVILCGCYQSLLSLPNIEVSGSQVRFIKAYHFENRNRWIGHLNSSTYLVGFHKPNTPG